MTTIFIVYNTIDVLIPKYKVNKKVKIYLGFFSTLEKAQSAIVRHKIENTSNNNYTLQEKTYSTKPNKVYWYIGTVTIPSCVTTSEGEIDHFLSLHYTLYNERLPREEHCYDIDQYII
jgi:hypothetical protein